MSWWRKIIRRPVPKPTPAPAPAPNPTPPPQSPVNPFWRPKPNPFTPGGGGGSGGGGSSSPSPPSGTVSSRDSGGQPISIVPDKGGASILTPTIGVPPQQLQAQKVAQQQSTAKQIASPSTSVMDSYKPYGTWDIPDRGTSRVEAWIKTPYRQTKKTILNFMGGKINVDAIENPFLLVGGTGILKRDKTAHYKYNPGTIMDFGLSSEKPFIEKVTFGDVQKDINLDRGLKIGKAEFEETTEADKYFGSLQKDIDSGAISYDVAVKKGDSYIDEANIRLGGKIEDIYSEKKDIPGLYVRTGERDLAIAKVGLDAGVIALGSVAPSIPVAYFGGRGIAKISKGVKEDIPIIQSLDKPVIVGWEESDLTKSGLMDIGMAGLSGAGLYSRNIRDIKTLEYQRFVDTPGKISGFNIGKQGKDFIITGQVTKATPEISGVTKFTIPVEQTSSGAFKIKAGAGTTTLKISDYSKRGMVKYGDDIVKTEMGYKIFGRGSVSESGSLIKNIKGLNVIENLPRDTFGTFGTGYYKPLYTSTMTQSTKKILRFDYPSILSTKKPFLPKISSRLDRTFNVKAEFGSDAMRFPFAGLTKQTEGGAWVVGAKPLKKRYGLDEFGTLSGKKSIISKPTESGFIKDLKFDFKGDTGVQVFVGGGQKTTQNFIQKSISVSATSGLKVSQKVSSQLLPKIKPIKPIESASPILVTRQTSAFYGTGMYERTESQTSFMQPQIQRSLTRQVIVQSPSISSATKTRQIPKLTSFSGISQKQIPMQKTIPMQKQIPLQRQQSKLTPRLTQPSITSPFRPSFKLTPRPFMIRVPPVGFFPRVGFGKGKGKVFKDSFAGKYTPSLGAVLKGIKSPMTKGVKFAETTGFQARPMISKKKKASKKKKKNK